MEAFKRLCVQVVVKVNNEHDREEEVRVTLGNITFSKELARRALKDEQARLDISDPAKSLKFSDDYVADFLKRCNLRRRRVTAADHDRPSVADVEKWLVQERQFIVDNGFEAWQIWSADETGICLCVQPTYQYIAEDQLRATGLPGKIKDRMTGMLSGNAAGIMMPSMLILKTYVKRGEGGNANDLTSGTILKRLLENRAYFKDGNWHYGTWRKTFTYEGKQSIYAYPYLVNHVTRQVVTVQPKAWMDGPRFAMWLELCVAPQAAKGKVLIYMDNHSSHDTPLVKSTIAGMPNLTVRFLIANMTDRLQVMDLVANGPVKRNMRTFRVNSLYDAFQDWAVNARANPATTPPWRPGAPKLDEAIEAFNVACTVFTTDKFQEGMRRSFVSIGLLPTHRRLDGTRNYVHYVSHESRPTSALEPIVEAFGMADVIAAIHEYEFDTDALPKTGADGDEYYEL
jgi:hypothetical protein